jgi:hypothetical protein
MPVPLVAIGLGMAGGAVITYVTSGGDPTKKELAVGMAVGGIPGVGLGVGGALKLGTRLGRLGSITARARKLKDLPPIGLAATFPSSPLYIGQGVYGIGSGMATTYVLGIAYDKVTHSSSGGSGRPGTATTSTTKRTRRVGSTHSHRPSRRPSSVRRRKRCPPGFRRVGNRCVPIRKGGRRRS